MLLLVTDTLLGAKHRRPARPNAAAGRAIGGAVVPTSLRAARKPKLGRINTGFGFAVRLPTRPAGRARRPFPSPSSSMKISLLLVAALALTLHTAAAQSGGSPLGVKPNYKVGGEPSSNKPKGKNIMTRSGGEGHNSVQAPKGKILVAPTTPAKTKGRTSSTNSPQ